MRLRPVLVVLFLLPLLWGAVSLLRAGSAYGVPDCPGIQLGPDGEEHPGRMRRVYTCSLYYNHTDDSAGTATYDQLKVARDHERGGLYRQGSLLTLYGLAGIGVTTAATRKRGPARPGLS
ncbi:hypothetical protein [Streptomyces sp. NPDC020951]|uniref:hypothetical protein n=1 Tax=Streptomyces sp. NPDC020951 TaxID=3365104 RepID=UPI0037B9CDF0